MSTYNDASLIYYPSGYKESKAYSLKPTDGSGDLTFTRASTATRVNESGLIEEVATGVPRIDYTSGCGTLLLEPQRSNVVTKSQSFADYYANRANKVDLGTPSIFTSGSIAEFTATSTDSRFGKIFIGISVGTIYTISAFFDISQGLYAGIRDNSGNYRIFNLQTGFLVGVGNGSIGLTATSVQIGTSNYYRVSFTITPSTTSAHFLIIGTSSGTNSTTNEKVVAGYFQKEDAASYATSYIPTTTTAVTRVSDSASKSGISSLIGQTEGTMFAEIELGITGATNRVFAVNDGTAFGNINMFSFNPQSRFQFEATPVNITTNIYPAGLYKVAVVYSPSGCAIWVNGSQAATTATATTTTNYSKLFVGDSPYGVGQNKRIQSAMIFKTRLADAELAALTTI